MEWTVENLASRDWFKDWDKKLDFLFMYGYLKWFLYHNFKIVELKLKWYEFSENLVSLISYYLLRYKMTYSRLQFIWKSGIMLAWNGISQIIQNLRYVTNYKQFIYTKNKSEGLKTS